MSRYNAILRTWRSNGNHRISTVRTNFSEAGWMPKWNVNNLWKNENQLLYNGLHLILADWLNLIFSRNSYEIMKSCWDLEPMKRPSFVDLLASLEKELTKTKDVSKWLSWLVVLMIMRELVQGNEWGSCSLPLSKRMLNNVFLMFFPYRICWKIRAS